MLSERFLFALVGYISNQHQKPKLAAKDFSQKVLICTALLDNLLNVSFKTSVI